MSRLMIFLLLVVGCAKSGDTESGGSEPGSVEPIEISAAPEDPGVAVGVRTVVHEGVTLEVWYPTSEDYSGTAPERLDFESFVTASFEAAIDGFELPDVFSDTIRDAPVRVLGERLPIVLFSHGFGGMRIQSFSAASHLASRGYVVVAPDHPGRMLTDVLPCIFSPPLDGCDLSGFGSDPGPAGLAAALRWVDEAAMSGPFMDILDVDRLGVMGHSAGAGSVSTYAESETRVMAVMPMAGGSVPAREVETLRMDGSCDGFVPAASPTIVEGRPLAGFVMLEGAGHLAFSDLCSLDIGGFAERFLEGREDLNSALFPQLRSLGTDGCAGVQPIVVDESCADGFMPLETSDLIMKYHSTVFFDRVLKGRDVDDDRIITGASVY